MMLIEYLFLYLVNMQKKYWNKLKAAQKISIMDILLSVLEFASSYNSYTSLRLRMHQIPADRLGSCFCVCILFNCFLFLFLFLNEFVAFNTWILFFILFFCCFCRPPLNLLRQELAGTSIYLDILQKTTAVFNSENDELDEKSSSQNGNLVVRTDAKLTGKVEEDKLQGFAEEKLVSFCGQVLREASDFQSSMGENTNMDVHRVLELRSPIIVKV